MPKILRCAPPSSHVCDFDWDSFHAKFINSHHKAWSYTKKKKTKMKKAYAKAN